MLYTYPEKNVYEHSIHTLRVNGYRSLYYFIGQFKK